MTWKVDYSYFERKLKKEREEVLEEIRDLEPKVEGNPLEDGEENTPFPTHIADIADIENRIDRDSYIINQLTQKLKDIDAAFLKTSALTGENINEAFHMMGKMFLEKEGFPRDGVKVEEEGNTKTFTSQPLPTPPKIDSELPKKEHMEQLFSTLTMLNDKITRLSDIMTALEERMLLVETKRFQIDSTNQEISSLKEKIETIDKEMLTMVDTSETTSQPTDHSVSELDLMVAVPTMDDLDTGKTPGNDTKYETLDRTSLDTMAVIDENSDEESITEILSETEPELEPITEEKQKETKTKPEKKKTKERCPKCGSKLSYIKQYNRWYCYRCKLYV